MNGCDLSQLYLACASTPDLQHGHLGIWSLQELLRGKAYQNLYQPTIFDEFSHSSPIKALSWNPLVPGMLATGGSTILDSVIRLYDINNLSDSTL